jgi:predicted DCC family thiol-disulfide oxidoreductase YuxK
VLVEEERSLPACLGAGARVVLFDGVCVLCSQWVQLVIANDRTGRLKLASVQSTAGRQILAWCGLSTDDFDTMVFVEDGRPYFKSTAFLRVVRHFRWPWQLLRIGWLLPNTLRDWLYDRVARNRYAWFGRRDACFLPTPNIQDRFLS